MVNKHAYLIMAHGNFELLEKLLRQIDDPRNDIYIHIDKKVAHFDFYYFQRICVYSQVIFTNKRINVKWGHSSQVKTEMSLYEMAAQRQYAYYHLISGVDLCLKIRRRSITFLIIKMWNIFIMKTKQAHGIIRD